MILTNIDEKKKVYFPELYGSTPFAGKTFAEIDIWLKESVYVKNYDSCHKICHPI